MYIGQLSKTHYRFEIYVMAAAKQTRIDLILVESDQTEITKVQAQLNQWWTKDELIKFDVQSVGDKLLFRVIRKKGD